MRSILVSSAIVCALFTSGCVYSEVGGALFMDVKGPIQATAQPSGPKTGKSCSTTFFGIVAMGDASIESAKRAGGVKKVTTVDHSSNNIIGYGTFCTIVTGE